MCACCVPAYVVCCTYADSCGLLAFFFFFLVFLYINMWYVIFFFSSFFPFFFYLYLFIGLLSFQSQGECAVNRPDEHPSRQQRLVPGLP